MKIKINCDFAKACESLKKQAQKNAENMITELAMIALAKIQKRTPVDTGRARAGWQIAKPDKYTALIYNSVEYIVYLEYGHSQQAPRGMVRLTAKEINDMLLRSE